MDAIHQKLFNIERSIPFEMLSELPFSLISAKGGGILYYAYLYRHTKQQKYLDIATRLIEDSLEKIENQPTEFSLGTGYAGLGWTIQHMMNLKLLSFDEDYLQELDEILIEQCKVDKENQNYDLLYGLMGKGIYFMERFPAGHSQQGLNIVLNYLDEMAIRPTGEERYWINPMESEGQINLGLAHGCASVVAFLVKLHDKGIERQRIVETLTHTCNWIIHSQSNRSSEAGSSFRTHSSGNIARALAWCQGDLGILKALKDAARIIPHHPVSRLVTDLSPIVDHRTLEESDLDVNEQQAIADSTFCHGSSGILHLMHRRGASETSQKYWLETTLRHMDINVASGRSRSGAMFYMNAKSEWVEDHGLLCGSTGIGMVLLSVLNPELKEWDSIFLTN